MCCQYEHKAQPVVQLEKFHWENWSLLLDIVGFLQKSIDEDFFYRSFNSSIIGKGIT